MNNNILGVDFGDVIRNGIPNGHYGSFDLPDKSFLESPDVPGALVSLQKLAEHFLEIHIVSRAQDTPEDRIKQWLKHKGYSEIIPLNRVHICGEYRHKSAICERLKVTHFVDDKLFAVLSQLKMVQYLFWFRSNLNLDLDSLYLLKERKIRVALSWRTLLPQIMSKI